MTECSIKLELPLGVGKRVVRIFDEGRVTSDGGLWLVRLADRKMGLTERMERSLKEWRQKGKVRHEVVDLLWQRVYLIAAEGFDIIVDTSSKASVVNGVFPLLRRGGSGSIRTYS